MQYAERDIIEQGEHYTAHISAMTAEGLHSKSAIAAELAHRDIEIERLRNALGAIWNKYLTGGSQHEPTTSLAGTLAYMAKKVLDELTPNSSNQPRTEAAAPLE